MNKSEKFWIIVGEAGAYTGTFFTRNGAIANRVEECLPEQYDVTEKKNMWKACRRRGDRAVKATLTWK